jgi:uncharacterized protein YbjQ (UPF0145 family)
MITALTGGKIRFTFDNGQSCEVIFGDNMATIFHGKDVYKMKADNFADFLFRRSKEYTPAENTARKETIKRATAAAMNPGTENDPVVVKKKRGRPRKNQ